MVRTSALTATAFASLLIAATASAQTTTAPSAAPPAPATSAPPSTPAPSAAAPAASSGAMAQPGSSHLQSAQQALQQGGYYKGKIDGKMGPHTRQAIRSFQQAKGLHASGHLDQKTLSALGVSS